MNINMIIFLLLFLSINLTTGCRSARCSSSPPICSAKEALELIKKGEKAKFAGMLDSELINEVNFDNDFDKMHELLKEHYSSSIKS